MDVYHRTLLQMLAEAFGVSTLPHSFFLDTGTSGYLSVLAEIDAATASRTLKPGNATLAAHCGHVAWIMGVANRMLDGERPTLNWDESWTVSIVDAAAWDALRAQLKTSYEGLVERLSAREALGDDDVMGSLITLVHVAYHLGEIKQMLSAF
ncbi:MAG TPA: DinB family protein [Anaerolineales bacterium]|nr:DinB family protein [Anaerolineales bacterium]HRF49870.1 DinB family protein [Anaerolineales bacterium]